jgi:hypothetical protein
LEHVPSPEALAMALFEALKRSEPDALVSVPPTAGRKTLIDGRFDLVAVAAVSLDLLSPNRDQSDS